MSTSTHRLDPDELAMLEEERDHLLTSLDDLEREFAVGDMDEVDYLALKDDYTVRTAEVLAAIEDRRSVMRPSPERTGRGRTALVAAGVLLFAVVAGVLVAQGAGQRGDGVITGAVNTLRAELVTCQTTSFRDPPAGIECYDRILEEAPDNVEALTYQGWAQIREDRIREGAANFARVVEIDPDYADVRVFRAIVASRGGDYETAAAEIDRFHRNNPTPAAVQVLQSQGLEREIFIRLLDERSRACWVEAANGEESSEPSSDPGQFLSGLGACLDGVLEQRPEDVDALVSRTYALLAGGTGELARGVELADRALAAGPDDPNAVLMHASVALADQRPEVASADLERLEELERPTISFLIGGPEQLRDALDPGDDGADAGAGPSTTADPETGPDTGGGVSIPNRDGG